MDSRGIINRDSEDMREFEMLEKVSNKYILEFISYVEVEKNYSTHTRDKYLKNLSFFLEYLVETASLNGNDINEEIILEVEKEEIRKFLQQLYRLRFKSTTISNYISTLKSFYNFCLQKDYISVKIMNGIEYPKKEDRLPKILYDSEVDVFFSQIDISKKFGKRDRALCRLLYTTGIRVTECVSLKLSDINFKDEQIRVFGKGKKERIVPIHPYALDSLRIYLEVERDMYLKDKSIENVFINNRGGVLTARGVRDIIYRISSKASVSLDLSPHTFRHTLATKLLNNGMDLRMVQEILGHESLSSTEVYTHLTKEDLAKTYKDAIERK